MLVCLRRSLWSLPPAEAIWMGLLPTATCMSLETCPSVPHQPPDTVALASSLHLVTDSARSTQLSHTVIPHAQRPWDNTCFKLLDLGTDLLYSNRQLIPHILPHICHHNPIKTALAVLSLTSVKTEDQCLKEIQEFV